MVAYTFEKAFALGIGIGPELEDYQVSALEWSERLGRKLASMRLIDVQSDSTD